METFALTNVRHMYCKVPPENRRQAVLKDYGLSDAASPDDIRAAVRRALAASDDGMTHPFVEQAFIEMIVELAQ